MIREFRANMTGENRANLVAAVLLWRTNKRGNFQPLTKWYNLRGIGISAACAPPIWLWWGTEYLL